MSRKRRHNVAPRIQAPVQAQATKSSETPQETKPAEVAEPSESEVSLPEAVQTPMSIPAITPVAEIAAPEPEGEIQSIQRTVVAEANAVLASNRKRDPVVTLMDNGIQRIDF